MIQILIVEDDDAIRSNIVRLLKLEGFETIAAPDGLQGLTLARATRPDLIISDVGMLTLERENASASPISSAFRARGDT